MGRYAAVSFRTFVFDLAEDRHAVNMQAGRQAIIPYCLAVTPCILAVTPTPYFRAKLLYRVILPPIHAPPAGPLEPVCSSCTCTCVVSVEESCIKRVENSLRTGLGLFH